MTHLLRLGRTLQPLRQSSRSLRASRSLPSVTPVRSLTTKGYYDAKPQKGIKIGHLFTGLALLGVSATSYGLYQFYTSYTAFPSPVRSQLRAALRSAGNLDYPRASKSFAAAYEMTKDLAAQGALGTAQEALMKTTGIAVKWGGMWEGVGERAKAMEAYDLGWKEVCDALDAERSTGEGIQGSRKLSGEEIMRGVAIALKMGDICVEAGKAGDLDAEKYFVWSVEEMLRLGMTEGQKSQVKIELEHGGVGPGKEPEDEKKDNGLELPAWLGKVELSAGLERLGDLYTRSGRPEYAQPLLLQAISVLLPPPPKDGTKLPVPEIRTRCHAATLMNNLSSSLVSASKPSPEAINQAARWARQAITVSTQCRRDAEAKNLGKAIPLADREDAECEMVAVVGSYNLGALSELAGDKSSAKQWYERSSVHSKRLGLARDGAADALRRLASSN